MLLNLRWLPARLLAEEAGWLLGFNMDEMSVLVSKKLLPPLGNPSQNGKKCFATVDLLRLSKDRDWLEKASKAVTNHWRSRNKTRLSKPTLGPC